jgi:uncharacterized protein YbjT (DUF2867 family)
MVRSSRVRQDESHQTRTAAAIARWYRHKSVQVVPVFVKKRQRSVPKMGPVLRQGNSRSEIMKVVVIGGTGLIGSKLVTNLRARGHEVLAASPNSGVNTITGEGLAAALAGAQVVVDVANSPSFEDKAVMEFFSTSGRNLLAAEAVANVKHHVALSIVGTDRVRSSGYLAAKMAQEEIIKASSIPYTILRSTQFFEFMPRIAQESIEGDRARVPSAMIQPILSDEVVAALTDIATSQPRNDTVEIAGPEQFHFAEIVRRVLDAKHDAREIVEDAHARYFGAELKDDELTPGEDEQVMIGVTRFDEWLSRSPPR